MGLKRRRVLLCRCPMWKLWTSTCGPASCLSSYLSSNMLPSTTAPPWRRWGRWGGGRSGRRRCFKTTTKIYRIMAYFVSPLWSHFDITSNFSFQKNKKFKALYKTSSLSRALRLILILRWNWISDFFCFPSHFELLTAEYKSKSI